ncbi:MAG: sugar transporter, partial [Bacteroidaceae bacterium]|nr:sugar transporter [Bacteroidaceae bacterium]MBQ5817844.1 sugar transporter [Bacteroidaceae bacterium]
MQQESRVKKSLLNARVNLIFYFLTLALSFFSRKTFLDCLGAEFIGLTGTLGNILGFLNLAESGISTAIAVVLYAPLYESNQQKIKEIVSVLGYLYHIIGKIILTGGLILACFFPLIFPEDELGLPIIYFTFASFLG